MLLLTLWSALLIVESQRLPTTAQRAALNDMGATRALAQAAGYVATPLYEEFCRIHGFVGCFPVNDISVYGGQINQVIIYKDETYEIPVSINDYWEEHVVLENEVVEEHFFDTVHGDESSTLIHYPAEGFWVGELSVDYETVIHLLPCEDADSSGCNTFGYFLKEENDAEIDDSWDYAEYEEDIDESAFELQDATFEGSDEEDDCELNCVSQHEDYGCETACDACWNHVDCLVQGLTSAQQCYESHCSDDEGPHADDDETFTSHALRRMLNDVSKDCVWKRVTTASDFQNLATQSQLTSWCSSRGNCFSQVLGIQQGDKCALEDGVVVYSLNFQGAQIQASAASSPNCWIVETCSFSTTFIVPQSNFPSFYRSQAGLLVAEFNQALHDSNLPHRMWLKKVAFKQWDTTKYGKTECLEESKQYKSDVVHCITPRSMGQKGSGGGWVYGSAYFPTQGKVKRGVSFSRVDSLPSNKHSHRHTAVHEIGHSLGAQHTKKNSNGKKSTMYKGSGSDNRLLEFFNNAQGSSNSKIQKNIAKINKYADDVASKNFDNTGNQQQGSFHVVDSDPSTAMQASSVFDMIVNGFTVIGFVSLLVLVYTKTCAPKREIGVRLGTHWGETYSSVTTAEAQ